MITTNEQFEQSLTALVRLYKAALGNLKNLYPKNPKLYAEGILDTLDNIEVIQTELYQYLHPTSQPEHSIPALHGATKSFNVLGMRADFLRRWNSGNSIAPTEEQTVQYVVEWATNLTREGWTELPTPDSFTDFEDKVLSYRLRSVGHPDYTEPVEPDLPAGQGFTDEQAAAIGRRMMGGQKKRASDEPDIGTDL